MKFTCPRATLAAAFAAVAAAVPSKTTKEICKNVRVEVSGKTVTLLGTDMEIGIRNSFGEVTDAKDGVALLSPKVLSILKESSAETVTIECSKGKVFVGVGLSEFKLATEEPVEFPDVPAFDEARYYVVPGQAMKTAIQRSLFATDVESTRYALGGVLLDFGPDSLTLAATDSRRLAVVRVPCSVRGADGALGAPVVPNKAMGMIERSIIDPEAEVHIAVHANDVVVRCGNTTIYARQVEGRFPRYQDVIPTKFEMEIPMVAGPLRSAVRQAMIVQNEESKGVDFHFGKGELTLVSQANDIGSSEIDMPIGFDGKPLKITFDPKYVADFLKVMDPTVQVTLHLIDPNSAAVFKEGESYTYVVMPLAQD